MHTNHQANPSYLMLPQEIRREWDTRETSTLGLRFILTPSHFIQGRLTLGCIAKIQNMYHKSAEAIISEDDRPKISSVVDNSSSASNNGNNRYRSSGKQIIMPRIIFMCSYSNVKYQDNL